MKKMLRVAIVLFFTLIAVGSSYHHHENEKIEHKDCVQCLLVSKAKAGLPSLIFVSLLGQSLLEGCPVLFNFKSISFCQKCNSANLERAPPV